MSIWQEFDFERRILRILRNAKRYRTLHRFGFPFLTAYQIAIEYACHYPEDFRQIGRPIGGKGANISNSLTHYIAWELSKRVQSGLLPMVEGAFLAPNHQGEIIFRHGRRKISVCTTGGSRELPIFRLRH